jgi:uncharacterized phage infection (PIP) family protein YhgE
MSQRRVILVPFAALLGSIAVVAAGCGGKSKPPTPTDWANGVCSALTTWKTSLTSAVDSVKGGNVTKDSVKSAADDAKDATNKLTDDLKKLGKPNTTAGAQAQQTVDQLSTQVSDGVDTIQTTVKNISSVSSALAAVTSVNSTLKTLQSDITTAYKTLSNIDPGGELQQAFRSAPDCASFRTSQ